MDMINGPLSYTNMGYVKQPNCLSPIMHYVSARISFRSNLLLSSTYLRNQSLIILHGFFYLSKYMQIYNYFWVLTCYMKLPHGGTKIMNVW